MATVTGLTAARMQEIANACIVDGGILLDDLILTTLDGTQINAGNVRGLPGDPGTNGDDAMVGDVITFANVQLTSEANPIVNALQLGVDGPGPHKGQHISTADNDTDGLGAELTINPGAAKGSNKAGQPLRLASGLSTGNTGDGAVVILTASAVGSGAAEAPQTDCVYFWGANLEKAVTPGTNDLQDLGYPSLRFRRLYLGTGIVLSSPDDTKNKTLAVDNDGKLTLDSAVVGDPPVKALLDDTFSTDNFASYTFWDSTTKGGLSVVGGELIVADALDHSWRGPNSLIDGKHIIKVIPGSSPNNLVNVGKYIDATHFFILQAAYNTLYMYKQNGASGAQMFALTHPGGTRPFWLVLRHHGNMVIGEVWVQDPTRGAKEPLYKSESLLAGSDATNLGSGVAGYPAARFAGFNGALGVTTDWHLDDWTAVSDKDRTGF